MSPFQKSGGSLMREGAVKYLRKIGWDVVIIMPNYRSTKFHIEKDLIQIPTLPILRITSKLQHIGVLEDYLDFWVKKAYKYLQNVITENDVIFATSGGELGTIKLASRLKKKIGCKVIGNFRDPVNYAFSNGKKIDKKFHVSREKVEGKYLSNLDIILTSSIFYKNSLKAKYELLKKKIFHNYFGYVKSVDLKMYSRISDKKLRICYMGTMTHAQKPEILLEAYELVPEKLKQKIEIVFIGNFRNYEKFNNYLNKKNIVFLDYMPHETLLEFIVKNVDVGFVSLINDYYGACVPSKIYEFINLGIPMIGALPEGDGRDIINKYSYGLACSYDDINGIADAITLFLDREFLITKKNSVLNEKFIWSMEHQISEVNKIILKLKNYI